MILTKSHTTTVRNWSRTTFAAANTGLTSSLCKEYISNYRKWLRKLHVYSTNIDTSDEDKHDTNCINKHKHEHRHARIAPVRSIPSFSKESKDAIMAAGNTELCEMVDVEPKSQCRACLTCWNAGIVHCTCGHLVKDDTTENKKYISSVLDLSIPNFYIRKGRPHGHR